MPSYKKSVKVTGKSADQLYEIVKDELDQLIKKFMVGSYEIIPDSKKFTFELKAKPVQAILYCKNESLILEGSLSLMLYPFKSKIDEAIDRWLEKTLQIKS